MNRRECLATLSIAASAAAPAVWAQAAYPSRPVKIVVGFPAGSATDIAARAVGDALGRRLGQAFVVDNRPGAASNVAAKTVTLAAPDGYTVFVGTVANTINAAFPNSTSPDLARDFVPVAMIGNVPNLLVVNPSLGVGSVNELIQAAKARPGQIAYASSGNGTSPHLSGELFCSMAGISMLHVPYRGSTPAVTDLLGGQVQAMFSPASSVLAHIRSGRLKALASTGAKRAAIAPELPTIDELGLKGFETSVWFGLLLPPGAAPELVARLHGATQAVLDLPEVQEPFRAQGIEVLKSSPEQFTRHIRSETAKWAKVIQAAGIKPE
jgi:tripartite-type tricarboxylate transporter receptor subunit TctC